MIASLTRRYGFRGTWLIIIGCLWVLFGTGLFLTDTTPRSWVLFEMVPIYYRAPVWWISGSIAVWSGLRGGDDTIGHVALYVMPAVRVISFSLAWLVYGGSWLLTQVGYLDATTGYPAGWYAALVWGFVSIMLALGAAWPNPSPPVVPHPDGRRA